MCTIGAVVIADASDRLRVFGFKNSDSAPVGYWHGIARSADGYSSLAYGLLPQTGVNAGMNECGLIVVSSFFGYADPVKEDKTAEHYWTGDLRGRVQGEALERCGTAADALALMQERFEESQEVSIGGSHVIADRDGHLFVFEHCRGQTAWEDATARGWAARSNQSKGLFVDAQTKQREEIVRDRAIRLRTAETCLEGVAGRRVERPEAVTDRLKRLLASHEADGGAAAGSVCAHGVVHGRSNAALPHDTLSSLIWDTGAMSMSYTLGQPCRSNWKRLVFDGEGRSDVV